VQQHQEKSQTAPFAKTEKSAAPAASKYASKLFEDDVSVFGIFDGELSFPQNRIHVHKNLAFLVSVPNENFDGRPIAGRVCEETTIRSLRLIAAKAYKRKRQGVHSVNLCGKGFGFQRDLEIAEQSAAV
jgi:hypothetical protein